VAIERFRQISTNINVQGLLDQIEQHPELWDIDESWTAGKPLLYATSNIVLRYNRSSMPGIFDWNREAFNILSAAQPIVFDLMRAIPGEHLGKVMISRLRPGEKIDWHVDQMPPGMPPYYQRYQVPLQVASGVRFVVEDEDRYLAPGTAWWFNNQCLHAVFNESPIDRLSMFTDIRPFIPYPG